MWWWLFFLAALGVVLFLTRAKQRPGLNYPLPWIPYLGNLIELVKHSQDAFVLMAEYAEKNKEKPYCVAVPGQTFRVLTSVADVEHMLRTNFDNYEKGAFFRDAFEELLGKGIFAADGEPWRAHRKAASHMFSLRKLRDHAFANFTKYAEDLIAQLDKKAPTDEFNIQQLYYAYTFDAFSTIAFGQQMHCLERPHPFPTAFDAANAVCSFRVILPPAGWKLMRFLKLGDEGKMVGYEKVLTDTVNKVIEDRLGKETAEGDYGSDLLGLFIEAYNKRNEKPTPQELRDTVLNFIIAGRDTTAWTMTAMTVTLNKHPQVLDLVLKELDSVLGDNLFPTYEQVESMRYLEQCMMETLRLFPSVPLQLKFPLQSDTFPDSGPIAAGDCVFYSSYIMGRMKSIWGEDALEFKPERWENEDKVSDCKFPAFNVGQRLCLGKPMAILETKLLMAILLRRYKFKLSPAHRMDFNLSATLAFRYGLPLSISRR